MQKYAVLGAALFAVAACQDATAPRPILNAPTRVNAANGVSQGDYIVVLKDAQTDPDGDAGALVRGHGGQLKHVYRKALKGFAVSNLPDAAVEALQKDPRVAYVERDAVVTIDGTQSPVPSWGLDRIDEVSLPLDNSYTYPNTGSGVTAYIIDTGINATHNDFGGRVLTGRDFIDGDTNPADCNGHGTHVAGTVGGTAYGVAKGVNLVAVRVLNCAGSGTNSGVAAGVDWVAANAIKPAVANMSLGGGLSTALNTAVANAVASGVTFAVAAGNSSANACGYSPASTPEAITVGATTSTDSRASYSNYGNCLDIFAPGSSITSAWTGSNSATNTISGTSMASPHVAGAAALVLGNNSALSPSQVRDLLVSQAIGGGVGNPGSGSPNVLLYVGAIGGGSTPPAQPPAFTVQLNKSCTGYTCTFIATAAGATTTEWNFGDGTPTETDFDLSVSHDYKNRGNYTVTLTAGNGTSQVTATQTVNCNPKKCQ